MDPDRAEHWLVDHVDDHPRVRGILVAADRRLVGGAAIVASFVILIAAAVIVGATFDTIGTDRGFARWDQAVAQWGPEHSSTWSADVLRHVTDLGGTWYLLAIMTAVGVADWVRRHDPTAVLFLLAVGVGVGLINNGLKLAIMRERPPGEHLVEAAGSSFPSGHSAAAAACWLAIALVVSTWLPRSWRSLVFGAAAVIALVVAASRALLGVHWLTDVVAGVVVGWAWFFLVAIAFGGRHQRLGGTVEEMSDSRRAA